MKRAEIVEYERFIHRKADDTCGEGGEIGCEDRIREASYDGAGSEIGGVNCRGIHTEITETALP